MKSITNESDNSVSADTIKRENESDNGAEPKKSQCSVCGQRFRFLKALQKHEARHQGSGGFVCRTCGLSFTSADAREKHRDKEHKVLRCRICNIRYKCESEYLQHINSLHEGRDRELSICSECGKQFKTSGELTQHVASKCGTVKQYGCAVCGQTLMTAGSLHNHMLRHSGHRAYMCRFCAKTFLTAGQLTVHERIHTQEKAFVCDVCGKGFCHRQSLITHSTLHTGVKPYQCEACGNAFSCVGNLLKHRRTHADTCGRVPLTTHRVQHPATRIKVHVNTPPAAKLRTAQRRRRLEQQKQAPQTTAPAADRDPLAIDMPVQPDTWIPHMHFQTTDNNIDDKSVLANLVISEVTSTACATDLNNCSNQIEGNIAAKTEPVENSELDDNWNNDTSTVQSDRDSDVSEDSVDLLTRKLKLAKLKKQGTKDVNKKKAKCKRKSTVDRAKLKQFIIERGFDEQNGLKCKYCGSHYSVPLWLMRHEQKHEQAMQNGDRKDLFKCSCCPSVFATKEECTTHQQCEHADQLTCKECERMFANPDSMKAHVNFHHRGVPRKKYVYVCDKCGQVFKQKALLAWHAQGGCGAGPQFRCDVCGKAFASKNVQKSHMRVHQADKPLLCKCCGKGFRWAGQLKVHERSHSGERPFRCALCPKAFPYRESLVTHASTHTGVRPHLCEACGSRFSCIGNLIKHRRTHAATCGLAHSTAIHIKTERVTHPHPNPS